MFIIQQFFELLLNFVKKFKQCKFLINFSGLNDIKPWQK